MAFFNCYWRVAANAANLNCPQITPLTGRKTGPDSPPPVGQS